VECQHLFVKVLANGDFVTSFGMGYSEAIRDFNLEREKERKRERWVAGVSKRVRVEFHTSHPT
jgi:hypothetical protein